MNNINSESHAYPGPRPKMFRCLRTEPTASV